MEPVKNEKQVKTEDKVWQTEPLRGKFSVVNQGDKKKSATCCVQEGNKETESEETQRYNESLPVDSKVKAITGGGRLRSPGDDEMSTSNRDPSNEKETNEPIVVTPRDILLGTFWSLKSLLVLTPQPLLTRNITHCGL